MNKIFGIGLPRTGTASLSEALTILGYKTRHYPKYIKRVIKFEALVDTPICNEFEKLDKIYPGSLFVWTVRDNIEKWLDSMEAASKRFRWHKLSPKGRGGPEVYKSHMDIFNTTSFDKNKMIIGYNKHTERVLNYFKNRVDMLQYNLCSGAGWQPLCSFLGREIPQEIFPHRNKKTV